MSAEADTTELDNDVATPPEHNETLDKEVLKEYDDKRRVERTYRRVITDPEDLIYIQPGDTYRSVDGYFREVKEVGPHISMTDGLHVRLETDDDEEDHIMHFGILQGALESDDPAWIEGTRTSRFSELEGVDY